MKSIFLQDVQYGDIDYMDEQRDFTTDPINYVGLDSYVNTIKSYGMRYIIILVSTLTKSLVIDEKGNLQQQNGEILSLSFRGTYKKRKYDIVPNQRGLQIILCLSIGYKDIQPTLNNRTIIFDLTKNQVLFAHNTLLFFVLAGSMYRQHSDKLCRIR